MFLYDRMRAYNDLRLAGCNMLQGLFFGQFGFKPLSGKQRVLGRGCEYNERWFDFKRAIKLFECIEMLMREHLGGNEYGRLVPVSRDNPRRNG